MEKNYQKRRQNLLAGMWGLVLLLFLAPNVHAQQDSLACSTISPWKATSVVVNSNSGHSGTGLSNGTNITDGNAETSATLTLVSRRYTEGLAICLVTQDAAVTFTINDPSNIYSTGNFVGIITDKDPLSFGNYDTFTMQAIDAGGNSVGGASTPQIENIGGGRFLLGIKATGPFTGVRISATLGAPTLCISQTVTMNIFSSSQIRYCTGTDNVPCNVSLKASTLTHENVTVTSGGLFVTGENNVISYSDDSYGSFGTFVISAGTRFIEVTDNATTYPANTFAGFVIENSNILTISLLDNLSLELYNGSTWVQTVPGSSLLIGGNVLSSSGRRTVGAVSEAPFNKIRIIESGLEVGLGETRVYNAVFQKLCEAAPAPCNTKDYLTLPRYPVTASSADVSAASVNVFTAAVNDLDNIIDGNTANYASISPTVQIAGSIQISVKKELNPFPAGYYAGFDIATSDFLSADLLGGIEVALYRKGVEEPIRAESGGDLLSLSTLFGGSNRTTLGFVSPAEFDEIRITFSSLIGANILSGLRIYGAVIQRFCPPTIPTECNTLTPATAPNLPVYVNGANTGVSSIGCVECSLSNTENITDSDVDNYATLLLPLNIATQASVSVANAIETYPAGSYAGFDIATPTLLGAELLGSIQIELYNDGVLVKEASSQGLILSATSTLLQDGFNRQIVGVVSDVPFDEVKIIFNQVAGVTLGNTRIYHAVFSPSCSDDINCNSTYYLTQSEFPAYINAERTGISGGVDLLSSIENAWNVVKHDNSYALITTNPSALGTASLSVIDGINTYPAGTYAGFTVVTNPAIANIDLLSSITITTWLNGQKQDEYSGPGSLIDLEIIGIPILGPGANRYNIGASTSKPFNEIQISVRSLAQITLLNEIEVYGAFVDTRNSQGGSLSCRIITNPDINVGYTGQVIAGDVSTNDTAPAGTTYAVANATTSEVPVFSGDGLGGYTFQAATPGVYTFDISVCKPGQDAGAGECAIETLTITVLNPTATTNSPVVNPDITATEGDDDAPAAVTINVRSNDSPGNPGAQLGTPTIITPPTNGTASIDGNGNVVYTPNPGFYGEDKLVYEVCEADGLCGSAEVKITVLNPESDGVVVTAADDYKMSPNNAQTTVGPASGVLANDRASNGGALTANLISPATVANAGTLTLSPDGSYTFAPVSEFVGSVSYVYEACSGSICEQATLYISVFDPDALPVTLSSFVVAKEGSAAQLSWSTTNEMNSAHFEVQRSFEGKSWHKLNVVNASGNSSILRTYTYTDTNPSEGINYYRLKMIDRDGTFEHSPIKSIRFENLSEISISPNPAAHLVKLTGRDLKNVEKVEVLSITGQVLYRATAGAISDGINVQNLPAGMYIISVTKTGGQVSTHKLMKN